MFGEKEEAFQTLLLVPKLPIVQIVPQEAPIEGLKNNIWKNKSINHTVLLQGMKLYKPSLLKGKDLNLERWMHKEGGRQGHGSTHQREGCPIFQKGQLWACWMKVQMPGSLPLTLCPSSNWGFLAWEWWELKGGTEPHTCQMICHYGGVSTQLSPPNHPSYPLSHPLLHPLYSSAPPQHPLHSSRSSGFTHGAAAPSAPPSYTLSWEKMYPCERPSTLRALFGCVMCVYAPMCVSIPFCVWIHVYIRPELQVLIPKVNRWSRIILEECVHWFRVQSRNKNPTDTKNTDNSHRYTISVNSSLSSLQVIGHTLFHWMQLPLGHASEWDRSSVISLPTVHQIISSCTQQVCLCGAQCGYYHILTTLQTSYPLSCVLSLLLTGWACISTPQKWGGEGGEYC